ncbi:hypothetical protein SKAU_G00211970 [Synaphobranchus kaupii]|uniref:Uncharacterized protein n=1 Tax=Synaphobranchus kaupii TaxID=118154 RepID=A0A9Q1F987_SYNKA|nr:hypothetical protein SKAU_G00211970 [Synaphobranchus kaupii]
MTIGVPRPHTEIVADQVSACHFAIQPGEETTNDITMFWAVGALTLSPNSRERTAEVTHGDLDLESQD